MPEQELRNRVEELILRHMNGIEEILSLEDAIKISKENELNVIGFINALATKLMLISEEESFNAKEEDIVKITNFIEDMASSNNHHPIDACFMLIKILSDMLIQLTVLEEMKDSEDNKVETIEAEIVE